MIVLASSRLLELDARLWKACRQTGSQVGLEAGVGKGLLD
jgi:hypothetical protein